MRINYPENFLQVPKESTRILTDESWLGEDKSIFSTPFEVLGYLSPKIDKSDILDEIAQNHHNNEFLLKASSSSNFEFQLDGETVCISSELKSIFNEIVHSTYILELENNWDEQGASSISKDLYWSAIRFLLIYSEELLRNGIVIQAPEINPAPNGDIHLSWRTQAARLLISVRNRDHEPQAIFYRDNYNSKNSNKGDISLFEIDESFFVWMKNLQ